MAYYAVWRILEYRPGCVDFCGSVYAESLDAAEMMARLMYSCESGERLDVQPDDEAP